MKKQIKYALALIGLFPIMGEVSAQEITAISCEPTEPIMSVNAQKNTSATIDASYKLPVPLTNLGTISQDDNAVCNLLFRHKDINGGAYLLASGDKAVVYKDASANNPSAWEWTVPGYSTDKLTTQDISIQYSTSGIYDMPTLTATTDNGQSTWNPQLTIKVGGESEITTMDCREWGTTYNLTALSYGDNMGYLGGTNAYNLAGFGNLFMLGSEDVYLNGVNVYLLKKPSKYEEGAYLKLQVWMPSITSTSAYFTYLPIEGDIVYMKDIKDKTDGAWVPITGGAVAQFKFSTPLSMYGKTVFFVTVEGFSNDPTTEDCCILIDQIGKTLDETSAANLLAHNSFARMNGEEDYVRPISYYGGGYGSFAICPLISFSDSSSITNTKDDASDFSAHFSDATTLVVNSETSACVSLYDISGKLIIKSDVQSGASTINLPALSKGMYIMKSSTGKSVKLIY